MSHFCHSGNVLSFRFQSLDVNLYPGSHGHWLVLDRGVLRPHARSCQAGGSAQVWAFRHKWSQAMQLLVFPRSPGSGIQDIYYGMSKMDRWAPVCPKNWWCQMSSCQWAANHVAFSFPICILLQQNFNTTKFNMLITGYNLFFPSAQFTSPLFT